MTKRKSPTGRLGLGAAARCFALTALVTSWPADFVHADNLAQATVAADSTAGTGAETEKKKDLPPKPVFTPEIEKELAAFLPKATEAKRKLWIEKMDKVIEKVAKTTGADDQGRKALDAPSREVVEICLVEWMDNYDRMIRAWMKQSPAEVLAQLKAMAEASGNLAASVNSLESTTAPQDHSAWAKALKRTLTPEQFVLWEKTLAEERQKLKAEIGDRLDGWLAPSRETMQESLFEKVAGISRSLNLPKEKTDQLKSLAKEAVDQSMVKMRDRQEKWLLAMEDEQRRQLLKNRRIYLGANTDEAPEDLSVWKTGFDKLLSTDERKQLETEAAEHKTRRARALSRLIAAEIDARVALTANQRQRLEPICARLAEKNVEMLTYPPGDSSIQLDLFGVLSSGFKSEGTEAQTILEPIQWQHWLEACTRLTAERNSRSRPAATKPPEEKPAVPPEPEEYEGILSDYLEVKARKLQEKALADSLLRAEDAGRAANLPAEKVELLKTAARGAVEESLRNWKTNAEQTVRSFVADTSPRLVKRRLENLQEYNFERRLETPPESQTLWTNTFKAALDAGQIAAAEKSAKDRDAFRSESLAAFIVAMFDESRPLTSEQHAKLTAAVMGTIREYQPDILSYFSGYNSTEWYLSGYSMLLPVAAIPEAELKSILGPESFELWSRSRLCAYAMNYWPNLKQNHDSRVKSAQK